MRKPVEYDAYCLHKAMEGAGTDEAVSTYNNVLYNINQLINLSQHLGFNRDIGFS